MEVSVKLLEERCLDYDELPAYDEHGEPLVLRLAIAGSESNPEHFFEVAKVKVEGFIDVTVGGRLSREKVRVTLNIGGGPHG